MASIPLPALDVRTPPQQNPADLLSLAMNLKQKQALMPGQLALQQQQVEAGGQENQIRAQQITDQKAQTAAMQEWDGKNLDDLPGLVLKHGGSAQTVMGLKTGIIKQKQDMANLTKDQLANEAALNDKLVGHIDAIQGITDPDQRAAQTKLQAAQILQDGSAKDPQTIQMVQAMASGQMVPTDDQLAMFKKGLTGHKQQVDDALKASEGAKNTAQAGEATAQTNKINTEINPNNPADPNIRKQKYEGILQKIQAGGLGDVTPNEVNFAKAYEFGQRKTTTQSDSLGVTSNNVSAPSGLQAAIAASRGAQPTTPQAGATPPGAAPSARPTAAAPSGGMPIPNTPSARDSLVDMIGQYKLNPMMLSRMVVKHPDIIAAVSQKYPDWNQPDYNAKNALMTKFTSGPESHEINAINTAMGHLKNLDDAVDALHNGDTTLLNKIGTYYNINLAGKTPEAAFQLIARRVGPEITAAYIPGGGGQGERVANEKDFDVNLPPQTLHNNAAVTVNMLRSKIGALENQYKTTVGRDDFNQRFITPEARASLQKLGGQGGGGAGISVKAPNGKTYIFQDQASADAFKQKAGIP